MGFPWTSTANKGKSSAALTRWVVLFKWVLPGDMGQLPATLVWWMEGHEVVGIVGNTLTSRSPGEGGIFVTSLV